MQFSCWEAMELMVVLDLSITSLLAKTIAVVDCSPETPRRAYSLTSESDTRRAFTDGPEDRVRVKNVINYNQHISNLFNQKSIQLDIADLMSRRNSLKCALSPRVPAFRVGLTRSGAVTHAIWNKIMA